MISRFIILQKPTIKGLTTGNSLPDPLLSISIFIFLSLLLFLAWKYGRKLRLIVDTKYGDRTLTEDILKQLYHVESCNKSTSIVALTGALKISEKRALRLIEIMSRNGLLIIKNDTLVLTNSGLDYALKIVRVHRLWEKYLSEKTGHHKSDWHELAEQKEHALTAEETEQLYDELGRPRFDPHGDPIPTDAGELRAEDYYPLPSLNVGAIARIVHIEDEPKAIYDQILSHKLHMGSQLKIIATNDHEVSFFSEGRDYQLSAVVASNISVIELSDEEIFEEQRVRLSSLNQGETATVQGISSECRGAARRRLLDLGFINGTIVVNEYDGPNSNPKAYKLRNTLIALRNDQADLILIEKNQNAYE